MVFEHEIDGACEFDGQDGVGFEFVAIHSGFQALCQWTQDQVIPLGNDGGFAKSPAQIRVAEFGPAQALDLAGAGDGAFDQAAIGEEILDGGKAVDVADFMEDGQGQVLTDAGCGLEQGEVAVGGLPGELEQFFFEEGQLRVIMADESQIILQGELAGGMIFEGEELFFPRIAVVRGLAEGGPVVGQLVRLDAGEQIGTVPHVKQPLAQEGTQGTFLGGINIARRNEIGAQQVANLFGVDPVIFVFAAMDGLEVERMGEHEVDAGGLTGIRQPIPAEHAFTADGQVVTIGSDEFEEELEVVVADVGVNQLFAVPVHEADIHLAGMEINSAVELGGRGVILHSDHSMWGRKTPVNAIGYAGSVVALPARRP